MAKIKTISVSGVDGSGKSTVSTILYKLALENKLPVVKIWFRFPYFFSYILLMFARIIGLTKTYRYGSRTYTIHFFEHIKQPYKLLLTVDYIINYIIRIITRKIIGVLIIFDREGLDSLVDYYVDTSDIVDSKSIIYRIFLREHLLPKQFTIIAEAPVKLLLERRPELLYDPKFLHRIAYYRILARRLKRQHKEQTIIIDTSRPLSETMSVLFRIVRTTIESFKPLGYSKKFSNPYIKAVFTNKYVILFTNWLLQGSFIASPVENIIRILLDVAAFITPLILLGNVWVAILTLLIAHTVNYIFNSNAAHTRRFFTRYPDIEDKVKKMVDYIRENLVNHRGVKEVVIFGSSIRRELGEHSDIDLRIVYRNGFSNIINAYYFLTKLRWFAIKNNIPLDAFLASEENTLKNISLEERTKYKPIVIKPEDGDDVHE